MLIQKHITGLSLIKMLYRLYTSVKKITEPKALENNLKNLQKNFNQQFISIKIQVNLYFTRISTTI